MGLKNVWKNAKKENLENYNKTSGNINMEKEPKIWSFLECF